MAEIRLLATDLDGTIIGSANEISLYGDFRERVNVMRRKHGTVWAACTGRSMRSFEEFFSPMRRMGLMPDYVVIRHAYIYGLKSFGYVPHFLWNLNIRYQLWLNSLRVRSALAEWHEIVTAGALGVKTLDRRKDRLRMRFSMEEAAVGAEKLLRERAQDHRLLQVFRYMNELDVRIIPFTKGLSLSELARHLEVHADNILAIGDGLNDLSMLDGAVATMTGCPVNAEAEVMEAVHRCGGHIATGRSLDGVLQVLDAYESGEVQSELPEWWCHPSTGKNPSVRKPRSRRRQRHIPAGVLAVAAFYAILTVFASFNMLPYISGWVMKPYILLFRLLTRIMEVLGI